MKITIEVKAAPGDIVSVRELEQRATIRQVSIDCFGNVKYLISYFANGDDKLCWLYCDQFELYEKVA